MKKIKKEKSAGGIVVKKIKGKQYIAVIHRLKQNDWTLPKGHVEKGESLETTAIREAKEETNNETTIIDKIDSFTYFVDDDKNNITYERTVYWFLMQSEKDESSSLNYETDEVRWVEIDDDFSFMNYNNDKSIVEKGIKLIKLLAGSIPN